ncbi:MAG: alpha/beta fold hydrolase [Solirubrobacterales bacterium]
MGTSRDLASDLRPPDRGGRSGGLAYALWLPGSAPPWPGVVILHGAGSRKENHADFAARAASMGWAALAFDQRGHGRSDGRMGPGALRDAAAMAALLAGVEGVSPGGVCVRGSSMGGFMAILAAAAQAEIAGAIAICPAEGALLAAGLRAGALDFEADRNALGDWLERQDLLAAAAAIGPRPLMLQHAEGDVQVPIAGTRRLFEAALEPKRLVEVPGGDHRSVQHDPGLQALSLAWTAEALGLA